MKQIKFCTGALIVMVISIILLSATALLALDQFGSSQKIDVVVIPFCYSTPDNNSFVQGAAEEYRERLRAEPQLNIYTQEQINLILKRENLPSCPTEEDMSKVSLDNLLKDEQTFIFIFIPNKEEFRVDILKLEEKNVVGKKGRLFFNDFPAKYPPKYVDWEFFIKDEKWLGR